MTSSTECHAEATDPDFHPADILMNLIVAFLAPMFLAGSDGDIGFARMAAIHTVQAYRARTHADLLSVAQIIGFGLTALGALSRSMAGDLSLSMMLRLHGSANALNRSAEQNRRALKQSQSEADAMPPAAANHNPLDEAEIVARVAATRKIATEAQRRMAVAQPPAAQTPAAHAPTTQMPVAQMPVAQMPVAQMPVAQMPVAQMPVAQAAPAQAPVPQIPPIQIPPIQIPPTRTPDAQIPGPELTTSQPPASTLSGLQRQTMWAAAMADVAAELTADLHTLPPAERRIASIRAAALSSTANTLISGEPIAALPFRLDPRHPNQPR